MKIFSRRKGTNLAEYALVTAFVSVVAGYALYSINPEIFITYFSKAFFNSSRSSGNITIGAIE
jgi:hypothetical protein